MTTFENISNISMLSFVKLHLSNISLQMTCLESLSSDLRAGSSILSLASTFFVAQVPNVLHVVAHRYVFEDGSKNIMSDRQNDLERNV